MSTSDHLTVPDRLERGPRRSEAEALDGAVWLIRLLCASIGTTDLAGSDVLDFGCGTRFTQAFLNRGVPVKRYVGIDVSHELVDFLAANVRDPRFEFHWIDSHNERYNPGGVKLTPDTALPFDDKFDVICLFSVFTHLAPDDSAALLALLRRYVKPGGRLVFSIFLDDPGEQESLMESLAKATADAVRVEKFRDMIPDEPLKWAVYSEAYARELITAAGWTAVSVGRPVSPYIQHHFVCAPA